jgi:NAD(P)-dependent dehydrogenase (short-subunit alcohol dehydrogenase family)
MTTAIIGTGGIGSAIARQLAAGGDLHDLVVSPAEAPALIRTPRLTFALGDASPALTPGVQIGGAGHAKRQR